MKEASRIKQNLDVLSFPRLPGTKEEKKAYNIIKEIIKELNVKSESQVFTFSSFYARGLPKIFFSLTFFLLLSTFMKNYISLTFIAILMIITSLFIINPKNIRLGKQFESQTIYTKCSSNKGENDSNSILLVAHLDSKGQRLTIKQRNFSFKLFTISFSVGFVMTCINSNIENIYIYIITLSFLILNLISVVMIDINTTNNKSPGAIDNASGVVILLDLLEYYKNLESRLNNYNLWFIFTGAEECGTMGIRNFCDIIEDINKEKSYVINLDGIGKKLHYVSNCINPKENIDLYGKFENIAKNLDINFEYKKRAFGVRTDGIILEGTGFRSIELGDHTTYKYYHSVNDSVDKVDIKLLNKTSNFIIEALKEIDTKKN